MGWDGSGNFIRSNLDKSGPTVWQQDASEPFAIEAVRHDQHDQDLAEGIENCLTRDNQNEPSTFVPWMRKNWWGGAAGGTANARTVTLSPAPLAYQNGMKISCTVPATNSGNTTLDVNGLGVRSVRRPDGTQLPANEMPAHATFEYDGTNFVLLNPVSALAVPTSRTLTAGDGLTGGGNLTADRTFNVDSTVIRTTGNQTLGGTKTFSAAVVLSTAGTTTSHAVRADRTITAGDGLSGGGNLTANRTIDVDGTVFRTSGNQSASGIKTFTGQVRPTAGSEGGVRIAGINTGANQGMWCVSVTTSLVQMVAFVNPNGVVGQIASGGTSTNYDTTSDYRLKTTAGAASSVMSKFRDLPVYQGRFNTESEGESRPTLLAHEIAENGFIGVVTGAKDAEREGGEIVPQMADYSKLVPYLMAAIKELDARLAAIE